MDAKTKQKVAIDIRDNSYDKHKRWMLNFYHENFGNQTFFFETKENMIKFAEQDGVIVGKMFYLEDVSI